MQPRFAFEVQLDKLLTSWGGARLSCVDNDLGAHQTTINGHRIGSNGFPACLDAVEEASNWKKRWVNCLMVVGQAAGSMHISALRILLLVKIYPNPLLKFA